MSISVSSSGLTKPTSDDKISTGTLAYINTRTMLRAYTLLIKELKLSGITQAQLARRLGKAPEVISRLLNRPSNLELKTLSELLFGISGAVLTFSVSRPLDTERESHGSFYKQTINPNDLSQKSSVEAPRQATANASNIQIRREGIELSSEKLAAAA